ncbi:ABC transporter permease [Ohtaekwangia koreensis]|uniref:Putative ABC transport system permease protein n=1 Tax=Ohtaekwangia koreensis TaxID=688867 RepID=A0A1T5M106_9BACT|nr:ABC transporter permease [Ohtaekwangia koreensis]SKC81907.1 putative ABC transport system permease protein [Ohtaekwangia koreensis]
MLYNYFTIALRNLLKNKTHTVINVAGLSLSIASVFLITLYIRGELSYDKFHDKAENLYRISWEDNNPQTRTPHPLAQALVQDFPEVESAVSLSPLWASGLTRETHSFRNPEKDARYDEKNILSVDSTFFKVFSFPLVKGDPENALKKVNGLLISESMAKKYFGESDPIGKHLSVDGDQYLVEIVGVFKDVPVYSHFHFDFLVSYVREKFLDPGSEYYMWKDFGHFNYIRLKPGTDAKQLESKIMEWSRKYINWSDHDLKSLARQHYGFKLQPVTDIHLKSRLRWELEPNGNIDYIYILTAAGLLILIIACINFINLTTAKSAERAKEIGVRKTMGALRSQLSLQFLTESVVVSMIAIVLSIVIVQISLPFFNDATGLSFQIQYSQYLFIFIAFGIFIGVLSGIYPALYLTSVKPHLILKGKFILTNTGARLRRGLIIFQFSMSMILISSTIIIFNQLNFLKNKNLGFDKDEVIIVPNKHDDGMKGFDVLRNELLKMEGVTSVSASSNIPGRQFNQHSIALAKKPQDHISSSEVYIDYDFFQALGIKLKDGRFFLRENPADLASTFIINETAAKQLNANGSVVGQEIIWDRDEYLIRGTVVGVIKDFHFQSLHEPIRPLLFALSTEQFNHILIKINTKNFDQKIAAIEKAYKIAEPYFGFEFTFLEDNLNQQYIAEQRTGLIVGGFSITAILIACFGLFGMSILTFHQRIKELSVRKVLGATSMNLFVMLVENFTKLILVSVLVSIPIVWWGMDAWLDNFDYKININPVTFIISGLVLILVSWITLSYFGVKASRLNPADTLKNE